MQRGVSVGQKSPPNAVQLHFSSKILNSVLQYICINAEGKTFLSTF